MTFAESKGTYGTFAFQGDAVTWTGPNVTRPNLSAWYVCEGQALFVNLGNYLYNTPSGCADETVSAFCLIAIIERTRALGWSGLADVCCRFTTTTMRMRTTKAAGDGWPGMERKSVLVSDHFCIWYYQSRMDGGCQYPVLCRSMISGETHAELRTCAHKIKNKKKIRVAAYLLPYDSLTLEIRPSSWKVLPPGVMR